MLGVLLVQREIALDAIAQRQPGQWVATGCAQKGQGLEIGQQADQLGLRLLKVLQICTAAGFSCHNTRADEANRVMHRLVRRFHVLRRRGVQRLEVAPVLQEPGPKTAEGVRERIEHVVSRRRSEYGAADNPAGPVHVRLDSGVEFGREGNGFER